VLTDGTRVPLRERAVFTAAWYLAEVLPNPPNPPSPWRGFLANKIVLDIWGGTFTNIADNLSKLAGYGITNCVASFTIGNAAAMTTPCPCTIQPTPITGVMPA